jgi:hypothetical protein
MVDMKQRYLKAYDVVGMLTTSGHNLQYVGCGIGLTIVVLSFYIGWAGVPLGVEIAVASWFGGIGMRALGQLMLCALDIAVNTSPLLSFQGKSQILEEGGTLASDEPPAPPDTPPASSLPS